MIELAEFLVIQSLDQSGLSGTNVSFDEYDRHFGE
jgi:hypothetical protein